MLVLVLIVALVCFALGVMLAGGGGVRDDRKARDGDRGRPAQGGGAEELKETLTRMTDALDRADLDRRRAHVEMVERLQGVVRVQDQLRLDTQALGRALREPRVRGRWGELHLRRLVEVSGMSGVCDFAEQVSLSGTKVVRPDLIIRLPGDRQVVVDAKAPLSAYSQALDAPGKTTIADAERRYARGLRAHVRKLATRGYTAHLSSTPELVVLYLPGEHLFSAALRVDPGLLEYAQAQGVTIATPTTLIALLKTVAHVWSGERASKNASEVVRLGRELHSRLTAHLATVELAGKRLNAAVQAHGASVASLKQSVLPASRAFERARGVSGHQSAEPPALPRATGQAHVAGRGMV